MRFDLFFGGEIYINGFAVSFGDNNVLDDDEKQKTKQKNTVTKLYIASPLMVKIEK